MFRENTYQGSVWLTASNDWVAEVNEIEADAEAFVNLKNTNKQLTQRNLDLQREVILLRKKLDRISELTDESDSIIRDSLKDVKMIPAQVTLNSVRKAENYLIINKGEADGVKKDMGVIGGIGVAGIVVLTAKYHSLVIPIINTKSNISCRIQGDQFFGYLKWDGKDSRYAILTDIPRYAKMKKGKVIETSGYSAVFPPGLYVGEVTNITNSTDGLAMQLTVKLGTDFEKLRDVYVIENPDRAETQMLLEMQTEKEKK